MMLRVSGVSAKMVYEDATTKLLPWNLSLSMQCNAGDHEEAKEALVDDARHLLSPRRLAVVNSVVIITSHGKYRSRPPKASVSEK